MTTATDEEYAKYVQQVFDYESTGYAAAEQGDYDTALKVWSDILGDEHQRACFDEASISEIAGNLAAIHFINGDNDKYQATIDEYKIDSERKAFIESSVE